MPTDGRKCEIVERIFQDHGDALIYCADHPCVTYPRQSGDCKDWYVFEVVPVEGK